MQANIQNVYNAALFILLISSGILSFLLIDKIDKIKKLTFGFKKIKESFDELDQQAKLIVRTDLDLHKAQEELDKRLNGLDALQKISRLISTTLDENEIFQRLNQPLLTELCFDKYIILSMQEEREIKALVSIGFSAEETEKIIIGLSNNTAVADFVKNRTLASSINSMLPADSPLVNAFDAKNYIITPFFAQNEPLGIMFAGNSSDSFALTEGDEELLSILADQIGQAVNNARLFEQSYKASQALEIKVQERTKQLSSALNEVQKISNTNSEFISAVSHELRTPLTSIKGYASILMTGKLGGIPDKVKERLAKINKHSDSLVKLINDLLDISRIESGKTEMRLIRQNIPDIVDNVQDILAPQAKEKNIQFVTEINSVPEILLDISQAERIFINLVSNAIKFTPEKGTITTRASADDENITVSISDTGIGISEENAGRLFNEFFRVENDINQTVKGSGLGLALAKKIVEAHGGKMWLKSKLNEGTTFYFTLPIKRASK